MTDPTFLKLLAEVRTNTGKTLLIADENLPGAPLATLAAANVTLLTNRYDVWLTAHEAGIDSYFNDFDFSTFTPGSYTRICYRVSKEKPVVHHIINSAFALLTNNGELILAGEKNDGLKTYSKKAATCFGGSSGAHTEKSGTSYLAFIQRESQSPAEPLDDKNYSQLRPVVEIDKHSLFSKPGVFGWNKIDQGSAFLVEQLPAFLNGLPNDSTLLDLGCGYGYIAVSASQYPFARIVATDNNAAALLACHRNFAELNINGEVIAGDAGSEIDAQFDVILCNPPFHQGFATDGGLTDKFLAATKRLLHPEGKALFVVNAFVPLPQKAASLFNNVETIAENRSYKVIAVKNGL